MSIKTQTATLTQLPQALMTDKYLSSRRTQYTSQRLCVSAPIPNLHRKRSFASLSCNQSLLNEAALDTPQWQQRKGSVCILFSVDVTHVYTHAHDKEEVFRPIWAVFHTVRHADRRVHAHTQNKNVWATCNAEPPNHYQLLCVNKTWHKSSDESATPNTLETLPRLAQRRRTGQIGRRGRWRRQGEGEKDTKGGRERDEEGKW